MEEGGIPDPRPSAVSERLGWLPLVTHCGRGEIGIATEEIGWVMMHAPFYNSNLGHLGEATVMMEDLEDLLFKHGVNIVLAGHVHSYERTWPVYKSPA
ncbi:PAP21 [Symbiodinium natans]|uniref:PAP21 protein n=1 Tax=Symbiodinium natans TaxID=878477 RepID=A0A812PW58_9DINO|nr:PAP21 [Symbiodinium natans]